MFCDSETETWGKGYWLATRHFTGEGFVAEIGSGSSVAGIKLRKAYF